MVPRDAPEPSGFRLVDPADVHRRGVERIRAGRYDVAPRAVDGGRRWPLSIVLMPDAPLGGVLAALTSRALVLAGKARPDHPDHLASGTLGCAHVTIRALEHRRPIPAGDPFATRCSAALDRAAARHRPPVLALDRVVLTPGGVIAAFHPVDPVDHLDGLAAHDTVDTHDTHGTLDTHGTHDTHDADVFRRHTLGAELGDDAHHEGLVCDRDLWYATLVHFRGPVADPEGLIEWADAWRPDPSATAVFPAASLCTYADTGRAMRPELRHVSPFGASHEA